MNETFLEKEPGKAEAAGAIASASTGVAAAALSVVTAACCVSPVVAPIIVSVLGASGAVWAAGLKPYSWWILGGAFVCLTYGFWTVYRPRRACSARRRGCPESDVAESGESVALVRGGVLDDGLASPRLIALVIDPLAQTESGCTFVARSSGEYCS